MLNRTGTQGFLTGVTFAMKINIINTGTRKAHSKHTLTFRVRSKSQ